MYFKTLFQKLGKKLTPQVHYQLLPHVRKGMQQFGPLVRAKGALTYGQVLTLLVQKPWRDFIPEEVRLNLNPALTLTLTLTLTVMGGPTSVHPRRGEHHQGEPGRRVGKRRGGDGSHPTLP